MSYRDDRSLIDRLWEWWYEIDWGLVVFVVCLLVLVGFAAWLVIDTIQNPLVREMYSRDLENLRWRVGELVEGVKTGIRIGSIVFLLVLGAAALALLIWMDPMGLGKAVAEVLLGLELAILALAIVVAITMPQIVELIKLMGISFR